MIDLTGANLIAYLRRIIEDAVNRNPRFRDTLGKVTHSYNNVIQWNDVQVTIKDVATEGTRLSPDYFMCKNYGRAIVAKIEQKDGAFVEWVREIDATRQTPEAGVYYFNVDSVDEKTNDVGLTIQQYRWVEGKVTNAQGSIVRIRPGIDGTQLSATNAQGQSVEVEAYERFMFLLQPTDTLILSQAGTPLTPLTDYWYERNQDVVLIDKTVGGSELTNIPIPFLSFTVTDDTGYELREGIDYSFYGAQWIQLGPYTPPGATITAHVLTKLDPTLTSGTNPENILHFGVLPSENLASGQVFIHTTSGDYNNVATNSDGSVTLPRLLKPGEWVRWEVRIDAGQTQKKARKYSLNADVLPGLHIAIGDSVSVGDQVAIIVSPSVCETYEQYGSRENLSFTIDVRSNDLQTSSDLSEMLKSQLLVMRRQNMEADGVTIFEARRTQRGEQRDNSGTAPSFTYTISVTASADWKVFLPLVTRVADLEIIDTAYIPDYAGKLQMVPRMHAFGTMQFIQAYS